MGSTVGPALAKQLISTLGASQVAVQGVDYPATIEVSHAATSKTSKHRADYKQSNVSLGSEGGPTMASLAEKAIKACPSTKIVLSGYSQGGLVIHYAVASAGLPVDDLNSVVIYGDPEDGTAIGSLPSSKLKEFCGRRAMQAR